MEIIAIPFLAVGPMVLYAFLLWWMDRYEKEPLSLILAAFFWGAVPAIIFSLVAQLILDIPIFAWFGSSLAGKLVGASLVAPFTEEPFKGLALLLLSFRREMDTPLDGILYGGLVGFGFATTENFFYFLNALGMAGLGGVLSLALFRAVVFGLNHALFTGCTGLGIALARTSPRQDVKIIAPLLGLAAGITLHALHNFGTTLAGLTCWAILFSLLADWSGVLALISILIYFSVRERSYLTQYLAEEAREGVIPAQDYAVICSYWRRAGQHLEALLRGDFRRWYRLGTYYRLASELAFAKHRMRTVRADPDTGRQVAQLQKELQQFRATYLSENGGVCPSGASSRPPGPRSEV